MEHRGFTLYRSANGVATTVEYHLPVSGTDGSLSNIIKKFEIIDAQYRAYKRWGMSGIALSSPIETNYTTVFEGQRAYNNIGTINSSGLYDNPYYDTFSTKPLPARYTQLFVIDCMKEWFYTTTNEYSVPFKYTAHERCTNLMNNTSTDSNGSVGCEAVKYCRSLTVGGATTTATKWDLPTRIQGMIIHAVADGIDELDPTANSYSNYKLGYTNPQGRIAFAYQYHSSEHYAIRGLWTCEQYTANNTHAYSITGYYGSGVGWPYSDYKRYYGGVVPIRELS